MVFVMCGALGGSAHQQVSTTLYPFPVDEARLEGMCAIRVSTTLYPFPVDEALREHPSISFIYQVHSREELSDLLGEADAVLYPSRWEGFGLSMMEALHAGAVLYPSLWKGFGLSMMEALHAGVPVIATDGWPMNEVVVNGSNGLLVEADNLGPFHADDHLCSLSSLPPQSCRTMLAPRWEVRVPALADAMIKLADSPGLLRALTAPAPAALLARQRAFAAVAQGLVAGT
ncbi:hypothetical protein T484DRAFT_1835228, partial [Baffinella frigidus]